MANLGTPTATAAVLNKYDFVFRKKYGQNFLVDMNMLEKIVDCAELTKEDCVLEIGPGIGTMTQYLAERAGKVIVVEIDGDLIPILKDTLGAYDNVTIIHQDILKVDLHQLVEEHLADRQKYKSFKVVANLPYYITTPIIMNLLEKKIPLDNITIMVQKEVAERMQVGPGTKDYGALSLAVQYYAKPEVMVSVPPECFMPRPKVASAVIRLTLYSEPPIKVSDPEYMFRLIRASFNQRRKTLANGLSNDSGLHLTREAVIEALRQMDLSETIRGETLTLEQFGELADRLKSK
ncbi:MAG: 16S rRNA (adenine(1518)-N(6)/adenine(1519)-N(6))-dimethyltransferase RsmA [Lachnospiraceae bacterium]|nr:16S rRNA (adenine(1518)-N(6)/adenine(1519)-N(6))-dimethyltransferase RsmA [Lachnospiraceae bacterium]